MDTADVRHSLTPHLPTYTQVRAFIQAMDGEAFPIYMAMMKQIWDQIGNPQANVDWRDPLEWIPIRLQGTERELAKRLWKKTDEHVNPRHSYWCWMLSDHYKMMEKDNQDCLKNTARGEEFITQPDGGLVMELDRQEGLLSVLQLVSEHSPCQRSEILPGYVEFCDTYTNYRSESVHKSSLYNRLVNLIDRGLIERNANRYSITDKGLAKLQQGASHIPGRAVTSKQTELQQLAHQISQEAREKFANYLSTMNPYKFEHLVCLLLQEMGYINVSVTSPSNDKGVDVVADIELGISSVREVVQVKRHSGSINRTVLDQLRGSLHRFKAMRGTIITTGTFSSGAKNGSLEQGTAPITLIDGEKLLDLLMDYEIGISKKSVDFYEFDEKKLLSIGEEQPESTESSE
ncbi:MAG: restriction endonuclease [Anaerolineaceae bacterium]|nr:restriction endonuclease [Anaerolineaceae bacterium]